MKDLIGFCVDNLKVIEDFNNGRILLTIELNNDDFDELKSLGYNTLIDRINDKYGFGLWHYRPLPIILKIERK